MDFRVDVAIRTSGKDKIDSLEKQINKLKNSHVKLNFTTDATSELAKLKKQIAELQSQRVRVKADTSSVKSDFQILKNLANEISQKRIKIAGLDTSKNANQIVTLTSQLKKLQSDYKVLYSTLGKNLNVSQIGQLENIFGKTTDRVNELNAKAKDLASTMSKATKPFNSLDAMTASNKTLTWLKNNTKAAKDYGEALTQLAAKQKTATSSAELSQYNKEVRNIVSQAQLAGKTGRSFTEDFKKAFGRIFQFTGAYGLIQNVMWQVPRQMVQAVRDINAAQIELRKVSEASNAQLTAYWDEAAESAKKYGATISDVISSTADWSRLGYNLDDSKILSDLTTLYQRVGDNMTQESASEALISTLQGYQMTADQAEHIVDAFNEVGNKFAIGSDGIGEALQRSASSMYAAGNTMEQTIGLVTAANTVVQDPDSVGTAFKTISMRIRGATTELEEAGLETDGMAESTASLRKEIMALSGVDIMKDANTFKSTYDILDELATKWQDLTDIQQASITELIAGKRQGNIVSALMSNFDIAREATETAYNSDGSAEKELKNFQKGIEYSLTTFKAQFQELSTTFLNADIFKGLIDSGTQFLNILTKILDVGGGLPAMLGTLTAIMGSRGHGKQKVIVFNALSYKIA